VRSRGVPPGAIVPLPADVFEDNIGSGYDLVLAPNIFHHFSKERCVALMQRLAAAVRPGGAIVIVELVTAAGAPSLWEKPTAREFSMTMLVGTEAGEAFTKADYDSFATAAGLTATVEHSHPIFPASVLVTRRR
jgi:hypothetical protein